MPAPEFRTHVSLPWQPIAEIDLCFPSEADELLKSSTLSNLRVQPDVTLGIPTENGYEYAYHGDNRRVVKAWHEPSFSWVDVGPIINRRKQLLANPKALEKPGYVFTGLAWDESLFNQTPWYGWQPMYTKEVIQTGPVTSIKNPDKNVGSLAKFSDRELLEIVVRATANAADLK